DLDVEQLLDRFLDLRLGRVHGDLEHDLVVFGRVGRLLGNQRRNDDVIMARIVGGHLNRASSASSAARVSTSLLRRMMSWTLMPATGSTSMFGILRAALRTSAATSAPSMKSALDRPSLSK